MASEAGKTVLFYVFAPLADPEAVRLWQRTLAEVGGLTGRILVSRHGINATVGGGIRAVKQYVRGTREYPAFRRADVKWSDGGSADFPKLSVKVRDEIVTFGVPGEVAVDETGIVDGGTRLTPDGLHTLLAERDDVVLFDGRNEIEAAIGRFRGAVVPPVTHTRDFVALLDSGAYDHLKGRPVVTYCTGGVRCEVLTSLMRHRGFSDVYQLDGGILRYGERFGDSGLWEGSLYVFDGRVSTDFTPGAAVIGTCSGCGAPTSRVVNVPDGGGRELAVRCPECTPDEAAQ
ncbi:rhodanese-related sulfurtransferase [Tsukamurella sp. 8F]|uniref:oxygen-dependent tRNA uridine(34) hydroxylase TrhO n=1 Tax=unclassified Tsukamurella TaxID=2633480 RepID=UPI0023B885CB|nr:MULTISPECIES: rhodanese-related sulfurtransferase [unclassified Tsukamurella]MDF0529714.1 rhodanese-related sulfurtransferase [Tsukamurella sp. 8J]MDF0585999.1 rhodanese-related sulfurtransferase [Tsukamurella sp. 8F]